MYWRGTCLSFHEFAVAHRREIIEPWDVCFTAWQHFLFVLLFRCKIISDTHLCYLIRWIVCNQCSLWGICLEIGPALCKIGLTDFVKMCKKRCLFEPIFSLEAIILAQQVIPSFFWNFVELAQPYDCNMHPGGTRSHPIPSHQNGSYTYTITKWPREFLFWGCSYL